MKADCAKFVRWSDEDKVFIGYCPDLIIGGVCHGENKAKVQNELLRIIAEETALRRRIQQPRPL